MVDCVQTNTEGASESICAFFPNEYKRASMKYYLKYLRGTK